MHLLKGLYSVALLAAACRGIPDLSARGEGGFLTNRLLDPDDLDLEDETWTEDQIHENILKNMDPAAVIHSSNLTEHIARRAGEDYVLYLEDKRLIKHVRPDEAARVLSKRVECEFTDGFYEPESTHSYWDPWVPASGCKKMDKGSGGTLAINYGWARTESMSFGLELFESTKVFKVVFGTSVAQTVSGSETFTCNIPKGSGVGQVWTRNKIAFLALRETECRFCTGVCFTLANADKKWAVWPYNTKTSVDAGCSTGYDNVLCD